ncbi:hypothetical protein ACFFKH_09545 [Micromonospora marina]|uniref:Uncharacterized protein n=1 Tax=Micromonospora marina TaxID=307120 RepID=A0A1C4XBX1_9ACTN|nr:MULTISPECIES: hypothetical protein [Micromonospora]SCF05956.1 hypothetical protein GA0070215_10740 [Micromonospora marina]
MSTSKGAIGAAVLAGAVILAPAAPATGAPSGVLSGKREVTIVRVQAFESVVSLDGGWLTEVDDDSGRQHFVPTPLGGGKYLIKSYGKRDGHPANDEPACWEVYHETSQPLTVQGAVCDATNPHQRFTITSQGRREYAISNSWAYLQYSPARGLILEELGDAPLLSTFRLVDAGPARTPAGG